MAFRSTAPDLRPPPVDAMLPALERLVTAESPSSEPRMTAACADVVARLGTRLLGVVPRRLAVGGRTQLCWRFGTPRVLLLGHLDTVWPPGTLALRPFQVIGERAVGPGVFDMKAGLVQGLFALAALARVGAADGAALVVTDDEETGSRTAGEFVVAAAREAGAVLVLEPSAPGGAVKTARKGVGRYTVSVHGRAAHAGLEPDRGVNAAVETAHQLLAVRRLHRPEAGTTVTPTLVTAGRAANQVPADGRIEVDVRVTDPAELTRVDRGMRQLLPVLPGARLEVDGVLTRPVFPATASAPLVAALSAAAARIGVPMPPTATVGGASDGNLTAAAEVPTLDGLGAVGGGAHAADEWVDVRAMPVRAALLAALVTELLERRGAVT